MKRRPFVIILVRDHRVDSLLGDTTEKNDDGELDEGEEGIEFGSRIRGNGRAPLFSGVCARASDRVEQTSVFCPVKQ